MKIYDHNGKKNICGQRMKDARLKNRMTQAQLAAKLQLNGVILERDCISRIEIGTRFVTDYELKTLSQVLGVSVDYLLEINS